MDAKILEKAEDLGRKVESVVDEFEEEGSSHREEDWKRLSLKRKSGSTRRRVDTWSRLSEKRDEDMYITKERDLGEVRMAVMRARSALPDSWGSSTNLRDLILALEPWETTSKRAQIERADRFGCQPQEATRIPFTELSPDRRCPIKVSSILSSIPMDDYPPYYHHVPDSVYHLVGPFFLLIFLCSLSQYSQPLHAPIPLPLQTQMIYPMDQPLMVPESVYCDPEQQQPYDYCSTDVSQSTFLTPSELLAELAANGLPATGDEFSSDNRSESARKARRRAMAKSVGFIPTDP